MPEPDNDDMTSQKQSLIQERDQLKRSTVINEQIDKAEARIQELLARAKSLGGEIAALERTEFISDKLMKERVKITQERINGLFKFVTFKMYKELINGGEEPTCETLIKGVPFPDANNAGRINAGIDIINALAKHYRTTAPIFVDNSEAVNKLLETESQLVELRVTDEKELTIK